MKKIATALNVHAISPLINFFSGVLLKISNPFKKGDFIEIDGQLGSVRRKGLQKTTITNLDGTYTVIENGKFYSSSLHNLTTKNIIRLAMSVNLCYTSDMGAAKEAITTFLNQNQKILKTPAPKLQVVKLKEKFVEISIQPWCLLDSFIELDQHLEDRLKLHLSSIGFHLKLDEFEFEKIGVTA